MAGLTLQTTLPNSDMSRYDAISRMWLSDPSGILTPPSERVQETFFEEHVADTEQSQLDSEPVVAVIGVGYVGIHIVQNFSRHYRVIAYDLSDRQLKSAQTQISHADNITFTTDQGLLYLVTHFLVSVPTLITPSGKVDSSFIRSALATIAVHAQPGSTIVIESSVSVGMTRTLLTDICRTHGFKAGMSPERVDPGRTTPAFTDIPKIVSGLDDVTAGSLSSIHNLYRPVFSHLVPVSSPEVAEMTKLYENCQRMMCVAFANEMADACAPLGIDAFEVARAAATKPFGYLPMSPSAGVGGHCIPVNPHYLFATSEFPLLKQATERMARRPSEVAHRALKRLRQSDRYRRGAKHKALVVGMGFKKGQAVMSHSPGKAIAESLSAEKDVEVHWADPLVEQERLPEMPKLDTEWCWTAEELNEYSLVVVAVKQAGLDWSVLQRLERPLIEEWQR